MPIRTFGEVTSELYSAWFETVKTEDHVPSRLARDLFHQAELFPSVSQVYEMLHCAQECSGRESPNILTFGEFCCFATELKRCYDHELPKPTALSRIMPESNGRMKKPERQISKSSPKYEVFLGGSCNPTTWRQDTAIPVLKQLGITYYNPQLPHWKPEYIELEHQAKENASVLFFVIDNQTRGVASMVEVAYLAALGRKLVVVISPYAGPGQEIAGEPITKREFEDLSHGQAILHDLVERQGIPIFTNIRVALDSTATLIKENLNLQDLGPRNMVSPVKMGHVPVGDKIMKYREAFDALDTSGKGELTLDDMCMAFRILTNRNLTSEEIQEIVYGHKGIGSMEEKQNVDPHSPAIHDSILIGFDEFCTIVSEFKQKQTEHQKVWDQFLAKTASALGTLAMPLVKAFEWVMPKKAWKQANGRRRITRDVYLGGSCSDASLAWREEIAIPMLKKKGLTYFNPQTSRWQDRLIPIESAAIDSSRVLLFVISDKTRGLASMATAAHYIGLGCHVVLCIQLLQELCKIGDDQLSAQAIKDYNRGRMYLSDMATRDGIPVFESISEAVECVVRKCNGR